MHRTSSSEFVSGAGFILAGLTFLIASRSYEFGTASNMGPSFFPVILALLIVLVGLLLCLQSFRGETTAMLTIGIRPALGTLLAIGAFAFLLRPGGMVLALTASLAISCFARPNPKAGEVLGIVAFLVLLAVLVFYVLLGLPANLWPDLDMISGGFGP